MKNRINEYDNSNQIFSVINQDAKKMKAKHKFIGMIQYRLASYPRIYTITEKCFRGFLRVINLTRSFKAKFMSDKVQNDNFYISKDRGFQRVFNSNREKTAVSIEPFRVPYQEEELFNNEVSDVQAIAYYLPQFHAIPENDIWWGKGFTEWTNTRKAEPLFKGHYQPRIPHDDIGYYDLSDVEVIKKQAAMAKRHGIKGFCFYHYWFHGKRLLSKPVDLFLEHPEIDLSFCLCWANETWSKKWDGKDHHMLIQQAFSSEDDLEFIKFLKPYFNDRRYIKVNGKAMLLIYRVSKMPNPKKTTERWRTWCYENGLGGIHLVAVCHGEVYPHISLNDIGFDAYAAFPPHNFPCREIFSDKGIFDGGYRFDYASGVESYILQPQIDSPTYQGCTLGWDNTARFGRKAQIYLNYSIKSYYRWLRNVINYTRDHFPQQERFLFINAWNEWAESAYLEPDKRCGYAYLNATSKALFDKPLGWDDPANEKQASQVYSLYNKDYKHLKQLIDDGADHTLSVISEFIGLESNVLEFGPASGYFTRYLKEEKNAIIDIVEIDADCAEAASIYARDCYIGDIESYLWKKTFSGQLYDHIVFADVLEHLRDPWKVLREASVMLNQDGTVLISVPNIAHMQILASLYNNDFSYADFGIMDKTHLRFFTELTLKEMINNAGLQLIELRPIIKPMLPHGCGTKWNKIKVPKQLWKMLKDKPYSTAIQFVACCRKKSDIQSGSLKI